MVPRFQKSDWSFLVVWLLQLALFALPIAEQGHRHAHFGGSSNQDDRCAICQLDQSNQADEPGNGSILDYRPDSYSTPILPDIATPERPEYSFAQPRSPPLS